MGAERRRDHDERGVHRNQHVVLTAEHVRHTAFLGERTARAKSLSATPTTLNPAFISAGYRDSLVWTPVPVITASRLSVATEDHSLHCILASRPLGERAGLPSVFRDGEGGGLGEGSGPAYARVRPLASPRALTIHHASAITSCLRYTVTKRVHARPLHDDEFCESHLDSGSRRGESLGSAVGVVTA